MICIVCKWFCIFFKIWHMKFLCWYAVLGKNPYNCDMIFIFKLLPIIAALTPESTVSSGVARRTQSEPVGKKPVRLRRSGIPNPFLIEGHYE